MTPDEPGGSVDGVTANLRATIDEQEAAKPFLRAQMTGKDITLNLLQVLKDERGVRVENAFGAIGSLAGASVALSMFEALSKENLRIEAPEVLIVSLSNGEKLLMGNYVNRKLAEGENIGEISVSLWGLVAGMAGELGHKPGFDLLEIFSRSSGAIGKETKPEIPVPPDHRPNASPEEYALLLLPHFLPILKRYLLNHQQYHLACAFSAQELMQQSVDHLSPDMAAQIIMEYAVTAAKLDLRAISAISSKASN